MNDDIKDLHILVVDDYSLTRDMVRSILRQLGFSNVIAAEDGRKALDKIKNFRFSLVICDWNMPNMSGIELLREVRKLPDYRSLKFLMLTAEASKENVVAAMEQGISGYIVKPFTAQVLAEKVEEVLSQVLTSR